ncbi:DUF3854 domain-containing protein [Spirulina sp. 06S082]|uniref:DUF3854 domain-containing protein n=1 Tax=Spirulina sp. 06S082 TaxID=3110248 RepID=UPI002B21D50B|nr:DUF3854 domain-containing protein [Spirulina sp. 06S082]MEA5469334.1 DUF3854 domain-containing protein [Spirulina sp. 06S082]
MLTETTEKVSQTSSIIPQKTSVKEFRVSHLQEFRRSAIDDKIAALNFKSLNEEESYEHLVYALPQEDRRNDGRLRSGILKQYQHFAHGGWWCKTVDPQTGDERLFGQFKPNNPRTDKKGKIIKYEAPPKAKTEAFFLEPTIEAWEKIAKRYDREFQFLPTWKTADFWRWIKVCNIPIFITEGAKKTAALLSAGYAAIGIVGIWNGCPKVQTSENLDPVPQLIPDLELFATEEREIYIAYDSDQKPETRNTVLYATKRLGRLLAEKGCQTHVINWDPALGKGVDDVIKKHGLETFEKLVSQATTFKIITRQNTPSSEVTNFLRNITIGEVSEEPSNVPDSEKIWTQEAYDELFGDKPWITIQDVMHQWTGKFYEAVEDALLLRTIARWLNTYTVRGKEEWDYKCKFAKPSSASTILQWAKQLTGVSVKSINPPGINLENGTLKIEWEGQTPKHKLIPHDLNNYYTYCSDAKYDPNANSEDCDRLLSALEPAQQDILLKLIAASLDLPGVREFTKVGRIRAALCQGTGSNGKDAIRATVKQMYGGKGMSICSLSDFQQYDQGRKFPLSALRDSRINWSSENSGALSLDSLESLKQSITGDSLTSEAKNKDGVDFDVKSVFFFNINLPPRIDASLDAIATRYCFLTFNKTFKTNPDPRKGELQADPRFKDSPTFIRDNILPAFLNKVLDALERLPIEGINYKATEVAIDEVRRESNHLIAFCQDTGLEVTPGAKTYLKDIWEKLEQWYIDNGTLEIEEKENGKPKYIWNEQVRRSDHNVKRNHVAARFLRLFPKAKKKKDSYFYLEGISFSESVFSEKVDDRDQADPQNPDSTIDNAIVNAQNSIDDRVRSLTIEENVDDRITDLSGSNSERSHTIVNDRQRSSTRSSMPLEPQSIADKEIQTLEDGDRQQDPEKTSDKLSGEEIEFMAGVLELCESLEDLEGWQIKNHCSPAEVKKIWAKISPEKKALFKQWKAEKGDHSHPQEENIIEIVELLENCDCMETYEVIVDVALETMKSLAKEGVLCGDLLELAIARLSPEQQAQIDKLENPPRETPIPVLKKGDRVVAIENQEWGVGIVQSIRDTGDGLSVHVNWKSIKEQFPIYIEGLDIAPPSKKRL